MILVLPFQEAAFDRADVISLLQDSSLRMYRMKLTLLQSHEEARIGLHLCYDAHLPWHSRFSI